LYFLRRIIMAFNKTGDNMPINIVDKCACGAPAQFNVNGKLICASCKNKLSEDNHESKQTKEISE